MSDDGPPLQQREESWPGGAPKARWSVIVADDGTELRHGLFEEFYENGMRARRGFYDNGLPVEIWTTWDNTGRQLHSGLYESITGEDAPEPDPADWDEPIEADDPDAPLNPRGTWVIECGVVLALAWLAPLTYAIFTDGVMTSSDNWVGVVEKDDSLFFWSEIPVFAASLQILIPLLYIIWRSDAKWSDIGIVRPGVLSLLVLGPLLAVASLGTDWVLVKLLDPPEPPAYWVVPVSAFMWVLFVLILLTNSLVEEFVWRGFILHRLKQLSGSSVFALLTSTFLFATYHIYQGPIYAGLAFLSGLIWGISVLVTRRIWPAVVAHTIHNVVVFSPLGETLFPAA
jgi:membrane protease YdiL (CAAX protease family)